MSDLDQILQEFVIESHEGLDRLNQDLLALEHHPQSAENIASAFRVVHTIKGSSGFLGLKNLEKLTHAGESLLEKLRSGQMEVNQQIVSVLLGLADEVGRYLKVIAGQKGDQGLQSEGLINSMRLAMEGRVEEGEAAAGADGGVSEDHSRTLDNSIRVDIGALDKLMNLVGELVLARNKIVQITGQRGNTDLMATSQHLNLVTTELQEAVMKTRMQPIGNVLGKFPRLVRDVALNCGKKVRLEITGADTEVDKTVLEAIKDPLTHLIRNSVDHGIERPEDRVAAGKPAEGNIHVRAFHEGGQVNIHISDDGRGIDSDAIREKALKSGAVTAEEVASMGEKDLVNLVFLPGLSTAEAVTNLSGRGVGMDVVKTNIEKTGGNVDIVNRLGRGVTVKIKIPLTLAIIPALVVSCAGARYAIPQINLMEVVKAGQSAGDRGVEFIKGTPVYRLRGTILPLIHLRDILGKPRASEDAREASIVVLKAIDRHFGLIVDEINDTQEIVVKPLSNKLKHLQAFSGATITGDGCVALILDVLGIAQKVRLVADGGEKAAMASRDAGAEETARAAGQSYLFFKVAGSARMAMPLSLIDRLEDVPAASLENASGREVVQYRGRILPLIRLAGLYGHGGGGDAETLQVIVYAEQGRRVGFVVDEILDVVEDQVSARQEGTRRGIQCSALLGRHVTDLLDIRTVIQDHCPEFYNERTKEAALS